MRHEVNVWGIPRAASLPPDRWKSVFEQMNSVFADDIRRKREHIAASAKLNAAIAFWPRLIYKGVYVQCINTYLH